MPARARTYCYIYARGGYICETGRLVEQTEHPKGNAVGVSYFGVINSEEAIGDILDLGECLSLPPHFKCVGVVHQEVTLSVECQLMGRVQLVNEKRLANCAYLGICGHGIKNIGVFHIEFLWFAKLIDAALVAVKHDDEAGPLQEMTHTKHTLPRSFNQSAEVGKVEGERHHTRKDNEETLHLGSCDILYVFHSRQVGVDDVGDDLLDGLGIALSCLAVKGIVAVVEVLCEEGENLCLSSDVKRYGFMERKKLFQGKLGKYLLMFQHKILAEGEARHVVENAATREICRGLVQLKHGRTTKDDVKSGVAVVDVLQLLRPCAKGIAMHFVDEEVGATMREMVVGEVQQVMVCEPKVIQGTVKGPRYLKIVELDVLKHHRGLANTARTPDAKHTHVPVDKVVHIALETYIYRLRKAG